MLPKLAILEQYQIPFLKSIVASVAIMPSLLALFFTQSDYILQDTCALPTVLAYPNGPAVVVLQTFVRLWQRFDMKYSNGITPSMPYTKLRGVCIVNVL